MASQRKKPDIGFNDGVGDILVGKRRSTINFIRLTLVGIAIVLVIAGTFAISLLISKKIVLQSHPSPPVVQDRLKTKIEHHQKIHISTMNIATKPLTPHKKSLISKNTAVVPAPKHAATATPKSKPTPKPTPIKKAPVKIVAQKSPAISYAIVVGSFQSEANAKTLRRTLAKQYPSVVIDDITLNQTRWLRVRVGHYATKAEARRIEGRLSLTYPTFIISVR